MEKRAYESTGETLIRPIIRRGRAYYTFVFSLMAVIVWGGYAYYTQLSEGLVVTGMRHIVLWGLYITNLVFFIGISHAGTLISAILRVTGAEWRRPITRMAESITVFALMVGALMPLIDLGRPDRMLNLVLYGRIQSPIIWDFISIATYLTGAIIYLYLPLIPDIADLRDRLTWKGWRGRVYKLLSLGWNGSEEQRKRLERAIKIMSVIIIPVAVSVHTVVSWIFGMTLRVGWHSSIFGPYFVVGAIFSGIATIIIAMFVFRRVYHLERYITALHFKHLGLMLLALDASYIYFTISEYLTASYGAEAADLELLGALFWGQYAPEFWVFAIGGLVIPAFMIALPRTRTPAGVTVAAILVNIGMWLKRFIIIIPTLSRPMLPYEWGQYQPTWVEWSITAASVAGFILLITIFSRFLPIVSVWETVGERMATEGGIPLPSTFTMAANTHSVPLSGEESDRV